MYRFFSLPIKAQLCLMAFLVALPAAGIIIYSGLDQRSNAMTEARTESQKLADNIATEQQIHVASAKQLLSALAQLPEIKARNKLKVQPILTDILRINPQFLNIFVTDRTGLMLVSAKPSHAAISISDRRHFINARTTGKFSSGEYIIGRLLGKPTLSFGYPYKDQKGNFCGVIVVNIDLEYSRDILLRSKLPPGSSYALIDHRGVILNRGIDPAPFIGKRDSPKLFQGMQDGPDSGNYIGPGLDGSIRFVNYRKLRLDDEQAPYMYIRAGIPLKMAVMKANKALFLNLGLLTPFMMVAFFLVWLIAKHSVVDRIYTLQRASRRLAAGELQTRVSHLVKGGELGELGRALDEMAVKLSREVAECKQAEDAQRESERFLRAIIDAEPECVKLLAPGGSLQMMNRAGLAMIGADSFDTVKGHSVYPLVASEYRDAFISLTEGVFHGREGSLEFELVGLNGCRLWLETHAVPFRNAQGEIASLLAITRDVTERKQAELKIATLNAALAERAAELEAANRELEAFNYTISHDLCKPLTLISGYCQAIQELSPPNLGPQCRDYLKEIYDNTLRMDVLIDTLLDFSRLTRMEVETERTDLSTLAQVVAAELSCTETERRVSFRIAEGLTANGDAKLLRIVLENLFGNAWKYTGNRPEAIIEFERLEVEGESVYCVRDNGTGFDMTHAEKLFVPFQRLPGSDQFKGHGVGLATVERIILRHGGRIWAEGEKGKGAAFYFTL